MHWRNLKMKKRIVCELCEGTQFEKVNGRFACKGCGTSYSIEEARGMMSEVGDEVSVETDVPIVSMPQFNSNQQQVDNLLVLASTAYDADNNKEAEAYCNRVIELDAMCYKAWFLKGRAIGWSSTLDNNRFEEAAHSFSKAIEFAPEDEKEDLKEHALDEFRRLGLAVIETRGDRFAQYPDDEELAGFDHDRKVLLDALNVLLSYGNAVSIPEEYFEEIAQLMNLAGVAALNNLREKWNKILYPDYSTWETYIGQLYNIESIIRAAIDASDDDDEEDIVRWKNLKIVLEEPMESCSYKDVWNSYLCEYEPQRDYRLPFSEMIMRKEQMAECDKMVAKIKRKLKVKKDAEKKKLQEEKKARIEAYWEAHADEKAILDAELKKLTEKKEKLNKEMSELEGQIIATESIGKVPSEDEMSRVKDQISELNSRRTKLGMFAGKEKKKIGEEIASLEGRVSALNARVEEEKKARKADAEVKVVTLKTKRDELKRQYDTAVKRIKAINNELTKDPEK